LVRILAACGYACGFYAAPTNTRTIKSKHLNLNEYNSPFSSSNKPGQPKELLVLWPGSS
jgi:hypothetical protein